MDIPKSWIIFSINRAVAENTEKRKPGNRRHNLEEFYMVLTFEDFPKNTRVQADVAIIGSGCGGAVMAYHLSKAGYDVVIAEEGSYYTPQEYGKMPPPEALHKLYRDNGGTLAIGSSKSPGIAIQQGRAVGGSSIINGGVCFRTPPFVIDHWRNKLGLTAFSHDELNRAFEEVEHHIHVRKMPKDLNNPAIKKLAKAAKKQGYEGGQIKRNVKDCDGCCKCVFGCPHQAKQDVLLTYLKKAQKHGLRIFANLKIHKIHKKRDIATGISGTVHHPLSGRKLAHVRIDAKLVIVAASALYTPYLLAKSGIGKASRELGKNLTLHPAARVYAIFKDRVEGWKGAFQSYAIDEFRKEGNHLINVFVPLNMMAATLPGAGIRGYKILEEFPRLGLFGSMVSDSSRGRVFGTPWGPIIYYDMNDQDKEKFIRGIKLAGNLWFDAGAQKLYLPFFHHSEIKSRDELNKISVNTVSPKFWEVTSAHPMGTCKIGNDPKTSVLDPYHRVHQFKNLYVTDSSSVPSSVAVNPQITIMGMATRAAWYLLENPVWKKI
ncbi:MAG: FAD-dependent oxidoreductase [Candidatus Hydrogenedentota bacterium]|nr:MAG: FAD-dependent oxidoreductase [Candidatus Hydrogenedentota bacterium]